MEMVRKEKTEGTAVDFVTVLVTFSFMGRSANAFRGGTSVVTLWSSLNRSFIN